MKILKLRLALLLVVSPLLMGNLKYSDSDNVDKSTVDTHAIITKMYDIRKDSIIDRDPNYYITNMARTLGVNYTALFKVMAFETNHTFDPKITNPYSGARGVIQFTNSTSRTLVSPDGRKLKDANDLVSTYPKFSDQMELPGFHNPKGGPVYQYLSRFGKINSDRDLFLAIFYPVAINWSDDYILPDIVRSQNPGVNTVGDYCTQLASKIIMSNTVIAD